jgi:hypothetical protein
MLKMTPRVLTAATMLLLSACGGTTASARRFGATQAAIRSASEVGAERDPVAALHLQYAREQFTQAEGLSRDGEGTRAERVLARAESDAELAMALTRRGVSQRAAVNAERQAREARPAPTLMP